MLGEAVEQLEAERCPRCGVYTWLCHHDDPHIRFRVEEDVCDGRRAVEEKEAMLRRTHKDYEPPPGSALVARPYTTDGSDFSEYRDLYYMKEAARREEILDSLRVS